MAALSAESDRPFSRGRRSNSRDRPSNSRDPSSSRRDRPSSLRNRRPYNRSPPDTILQQPAGTTNASQTGHKTVPSHAPTASRGN
jgi:hypothetical protein